MNADSKASIRFEAFFYSGEDCNNNDNLSFEETVGYRFDKLTTAGRKWTTHNSFDMELFENVTESSINFKLTLAGGGTDVEWRMAIQTLCRRC